MIPFGIIFQQKKVECHKTCFLRDFGESESAKFYSSGNQGVKKWPGPRGSGSSGFPVASLDRAFTLHVWGKIKQEIMLWTTNEAQKWLIIIMEYGSMGCQDFKGGIQNKIDFWPKN